MLEISTDGIKRHSSICGKTSPHHSNNDVADGEGCDPGPDVGGDRFLLFISECKSQDDQDKNELDCDF